MIDTKTIPTCSGIYKITNRANNKIYIGQAKNLRNRIKSHLKDFKNNKSNSYFYKAIKKHGIENFELEILFQGNISKEDLNDLEIDFIRLYNSNHRNFGYNMTLGGEGTVGFKHKPETIEKMSRFRLGRKATEEAKQKMSKSRKGKKLSEEHKQKMSESQKGKPSPLKGRKGFKHKEEVKQKMSQDRKGKPGHPVTKETIEKTIKTRMQNGGYGMTEEAKKRMVETRMKKDGYKQTEQTKEKIRKSYTGKKYTQEEKDRMNAKKKATIEFKKNMKLIQENNFIYDWLF